VKLIAVSPVQKQTVTKSLFVVFLYRLTVVGENALAPPSLVPCSVTPLLAVAVAVGVGVPPAAVALAVTVAVGALAVGVGVPEGVDEEVGVGVAPDRP
jgi:hypothetical protein